MKKGLIIVIALLLAVPAVSFAGSATSRWDMTIGGFVKFDVGWASQATAGALDQYFAERSNRAGNQNTSNDSGAFGMASGQTTLNFLVKGPDAWGAKTSAFIQGTFIGQTINNNNMAAVPYPGQGSRYGNFALQLAYMDFTWANTKLTAGYAWQSWGFLPTFNILGLYDILMAGRGNTVPQVTVTQNFSKSFYGSFGIQEPSNYRDNMGMAMTAGNAQGLNNQGTNPQGAVATNTRTVNEIPDFTMELGYKSDACGKIGPNMMQFAVSGFAGQERVLYTDPTNANRAKHDTLSRWAANFKAFIPIIPEKNLNKTGALSVSGALWTGQNLNDWYLGARNIGSLYAYDADPTASGVRYAVPVTAGGWGNLNFFLTDKVQVNGIYAWMRNYTSSRYEVLNPNQFKTWSQIIANILYDVNPAVRFGVEYCYAATNYNWWGTAGVAGGNSVSLAPGANGTGLDTKGQIHTGRVAAWYFF